MSSAKRKNSEEETINRTQTVYHYYNSKTRKEVSSTDKRVIDSILKANAIEKDTINH